MQIQSEFRPAPWSRNRHLQTMWATLMRRQELIKTTPERLLMPDGDFIDLAWTTHPPPGYDRPIVVIFHGLEGSAQSPYAQGMMRAIAMAGWVGVLMHFRGCSGEPNRLTRAYHAGETGDASFFLNILRNRFPKSSIAAIGYSLGGNMLTCLLGQHGARSHLTCAAVVSAPLDLSACAQTIQQGASRIYDGWLLADLKRVVRRKLPHVPALGEAGINLKMLRGLRTIRDFDEQITAPLHGFAGAEDYYAKCSGLAFINAIDRPTLFIHAADDPFMDQRVIPDVQNLPDCVTYELSTHGGHVGFVHGHLKSPEYWLETRIPRWFRTHLHAG